MPVNASAAANRRSACKLQPDARQSDSTDVNGVNYTTLVFGNGPNRLNVARAPLTTATVTADAYLQESGVRTAAGSETHGGGDVMLYATGAGAQTFKGTMDNTKVFTLLKNAYGF